MMNMMDFADTDLKIFFTIFKDSKARGIEGENRVLQYNQSTNQLNV